MAVFNDLHYKGNDAYAEGNIENVVFNIVSKPGYSDGINAYTGNDYAIASHLSPLRENILSWYPFKKDATCVEIGSGCGAITGVLARKLKQVISIDLSKRRGLVNYKRHREYNNLEIIIANFNELSLKGHYDYVVINGAFEHAARFTPGPNPYATFLQNIKKILKPDGKILLTMDNRLGLKYFNGAREFHTDKYFFGLGGKQDSDVKTFLKSEISKLLQDAGFKYNKFYYPFPDFRFPTEIFTDYTINRVGFGSDGNYANVDDYRFSLFDEPAVRNTLKAEEIAGEFANSFLIESSMVEFKTDVEYVDMLKFEAQKKNIIKPVKEISLDKMRDDDDSRKYFKMSLYIDSGDGYIESEKYVQDVPIGKGTFDVVFSLYKEDKIRSLRFDPVEGRYIKCSIDKLSEGYSVSRHNGLDFNKNDRNDNSVIFLTEDPRFDIRPGRDTRLLRITGTIQELSIAEMAEEVKMALDNAEQPRRRGIM